MQSLSLIFDQTWFGKLPPDLQELIFTSIKLLEQEKQKKNSFTDYSFIVFPMSKAYEGFLKLYLLNKNLINKQVYLGHRFRIGRALNPDLRYSYRDEQWLFDDLEADCGVDIAREVWEVWLKCRNQVFHYFPEETHALTLEKAEHYLSLMIDVMIKMTPYLPEKLKEPHVRANHL
jgi:hypothetical protein